MFNGFLGISGTAVVRDLWARKNIGVFNGKFSQKLPLHGAGLYLVTPR